MSRTSSHPDDRRIADNLRRTIELTELGLPLRQAVIEQRNGLGAGEGIARLMHEIRPAKEQAWQQSQSKSRRSPCLTFNTASRRRQNQSDARFRARPYRALPARLLF